MINLGQATQIIEKNIPGGLIVAQVEYRNLYLFQVYIDSPMEEGFDPYYSVDKETGAFSDFSILTDGNFTEICNLFIEAQKAKSI